MAKEFVGNAKEIGLEKIELKMKQDNFFKKDGVIYDRVTSILDTYKAPELINWQIKTGKREAGRIATIAQKIGSNVDAWIRSDISGDKAPKLLFAEAETCVKAWEKFKEDYQIDVKKLRAGTRIFDEETKVCGEPDILDEINRTVIDIKCSGSIRETYWVQTDWYARHLDYIKKAILRLDKNLGIYEFEVRPINDADRDVFNALAVVYRYFNPDQRSDNNEENV